MTAYDTHHTNRITNTDSIILDILLIQNYHLTKKEQTFSLTALDSNELHKIRRKIGKNRRKTVFQSHCESRK